MASAYPEGECFFARSALSSSVYNANDPKDFYSTYGTGKLIMAGTKVKAIDIPDPGTRSSKGPIGELTTETGPTCPSATGLIRKRSPDAFNTIFCLASIRAIYHPVAHAVSEDHPDLCSFVQIHFALDRTVKFWRGEGNFNDVKTDAVLGLPVNKHRTLVLHPYKLIQLLTLPRQLRKDNCYNLKLLKLRQSISLQPHPNTSKSYSNGPDVASTTIAKGNFGLDLTWKSPNKSTWEENFSRTSFISESASGPILQIMFSVGWQLVIQEDAEAAYSALKDAVSSVDIYDKMIRDLDT
ncbi:MAG: hypothetical protein Q9200_007627, partial [Gallowayella weberi]